MFGDMLPKTPLGTVVAERHCLLWTLKAGTRNRCLNWRTDAD